MEREIIFNFKWAIDKIPGFRQHFEMAQRVKRDEQRYRDIPGYEPRKEVLS